jgi:trans-aconitate 2-methyltransferase
MSWNPDTYHKFRKERFAPFDDLLNLVVIGEGLKVLDLGCGTGELTEMLAERLPGSDVLGIDSSPEMLEYAKTRERPGLGFELRSIEELSGEWDLVFSNAAIQWVKGHAQLIPKLLLSVKPGGQLAIQLPSNHNHETQTLINEIAREEPYKEALGGWTRTSNVLTIREYAELLYDNGGTEIVVFEKVFPHILNDAEAVVDWLSGTVLLLYLERLPEELHERFRKRCITRISDRFHTKPIFYPFQRTFLSAIRADLHG